MDINNLLLDFTAKFCLYKVQSILPEALIGIKYLRQTDDMTCTVRHCLVNDDLHKHMLIENEECLPRQRFSSSPLPFIMNCGILQSDSFSSPMFVNNYVILSIYL